MKIHLNQIPPEGLHLERTEARDIIGLEDERVRVTGPVGYSLDVGISGSSLWATGRLSVDTELECVCCLGRFKYTVSVDPFAVQIEHENAESVDLTPYEREDILLTLPAYPHCDWDGKTACPGRPKLKKTKDLETEPAPGINAAWEKLDQLKLGVRHGSS